MVALPEVIDVNTLAELLMLDPRRIQQLADEDIVKKEKRGEYELLLSVQGYINYLRERADGNPTVMLEHKVRLAKAKADTAEMEAAQMKGQLLEAEQVQSTWESLLGHVRTRFLAMVDRKTPAIFGATNVKQAKEIHKKAVYAALGECAGTEVDTITGHTSA